jgi:hypothetical protein
VSTSRSPESTLCHAIAEDLETIGLPTHQLFVVRRPRYLGPDLCPALVIWLDDDEPLRGEGSGQTTMRFPSRLSIGIAWHEESVNEAVTLQTDDDLSDSMLNARRMIKDRVLIWARDGIAGMVVGKPYDQCLIDVGRAGFFQTPEEEGLTEGYAVQVLVTQVETPH